ncbi:MAG TPA: trypsin-like peptidase domain-containing protein [Gemmataceae bacterium]|nr:trypsin-like peptidase domain-containing protein [Gemmataceae bacterium]
MNRLIRIGASASAVLLCFAGSVRADEAATKEIAEVNKKIVKVWGSGGLHGLPGFGTGFLISGDGYILTADAQLLDTRDLRVHLWDGTKYHAEVIAQEPELDVALIKIKPASDADKIEDLPHFDLEETAKRPPVDVGTEVLAFSNCFEIATRNDPVSVQHAYVTAFAKLQGRNGFYEMPYNGKVYMVDAVTNNPGAAGGALTTRKGELIGMIGRGLRNELTGTWMNYSIPINAAAEVTQPDGKVVKTSIVDVWLQKEKYIKANANGQQTKPGRTFDRILRETTGIVLVADPVDITPPYIDDVVPGSPAAQAGMRSDDLIVYVGGVSVKTVDDYKQMMFHYPPGQKVQLELRRGDTLMTVELTLAKLAERK